MVNIEKRIVPLSNRRAIYSGINQRRTLTVHQTGNTAKGANADMHAWLQHRGYARASWHIQSDDHRIIQSFPFSAQTWHAGDGRGNGNLHSISWEICINRDGDYLKSLQVAAEGIAQVLKDERLTVNDLRQHHDWSRKNCPAQIRAGKDGVNWNKFKQMVQKAYDGGTVSKPVKPSVSDRPDANLTFNQVVDKTIAGDYGSQPHRENNIRTRTNFSYEEIQEGVNRKLRATPSKPSKMNFDTVVNNVIDGAYGNGQARFDKIKSLGHDPAKVQAEVNKRLLGKAPSKPKPKAKPKGRKLHLPATAKTWRIYNVNGPYTARNAIHQLTPSAFGGITYDILEDKGNHIYIINTGVKGRVAIYAAPSTGARIT